MINHCGNKIQKHPSRHPHRRAASGVMPRPMNAIVSYLAVLLPMIVLDALWILVVAKGFYAARMGFLFQSPVQMAPVAVFYPLYAAAILLLAVLPAAARASWTEAVWRGALLGVAAYAAYDLTNHATIARWPLAMTVVDIAWGVCVTAAVSLVAYAVIKHFQ